MSTFLLPDPAAETCGEMEKNDVVYDMITGTHASIRGLSEIHLTGVTTSRSRAAVHICISTSYIRYPLIARRPQDMEIENAIAPEEEFSVTSAQPMTNGPAPMGSPPALSMTAAAGKGPTAGSVDRQVVKEELGGIMDLHDLEIGGAGGGGVAPEGDLCLSTVTTKPEFS